MNKIYIYTVALKQTGEILALGPVGECARITGLSKATIRDQAIHERDAYATPLRSKYKVTRVYMDISPFVKPKRRTASSAKTGK